MADPTRPAAEPAGGADAQFTRRKLIVSGVAGMATVYGATADNITQDPSIQFATRAP